MPHAPSHPHARLPRPLPRAFRTLALALAALLLTPLAAAQETPRAPAGTPGALVGTWRGAIGPDVIDLEVVVAFEARGEALAGTIDIPAQGADDLPLEAIEVDGPRVRFRIAGVAGRPTFDGEVSSGGDAIAGTFTQGGQPLDFRLERENERARSHAAEPTAYREVELRYPSGDVTLEGTLTLPEGEGPFPAALLISGSGAQDRDQTILGHRTFGVLAERLARAGVATLRSDDRGVGGSGGDLLASDYEMLIGDARSGVAQLRGHPEIDPARVGAVGHSEGGVLAPLLAEAEPELAFVVLLAAPAAPGAEVLRLQNRLLFELAGASDAQIEAQLAFLDRLARALGRGDLASARSLTEARVAEQFAELPDAERPGTAVVAAQTEAQVAFLASPYFRSFVAYDPQPALQALEVPVLAIYGRQDLQVPLAQNEGRMRGALRLAPTDDATVRVFDGLNHLLQPAGTGAPAEYAEIETTLDPAVLDAVAEWIVARFVR